MNPIIIKTDLITPLTQIKSVTPITSVTAILDSQNSATEFEQGQKYQALIDARLFNGNSRVLVADKLLQMRLPENFQPGNKLELVFISHEPKLKFLILNEVPLSTKENDTFISSTGRLLGALMQDALRQLSTGTASTITTSSLTSSTPIFAGMPENSTELPGLLQKAIVQSGLFYESHQAQWINGENTLENLRQEPQGKLMPVTADLPTVKATTSVSLGSDMLVHTQSVPLVQQQLNTLETGHLFWRGEVWQGQPMEWDIHEQPSGNEIESEYAAQWHTQIRLSMPQLGDITARITLDARGINVKLDASQLETINLFRNNQLPLAINMQSAGLTIQSVEIQHNDP